MYDNGCHDTFIFIHKRKEEGWRWVEDNGITIAKKYFYVIRIAIDGKPPMSCSVASKSMKRKETCIGESCWNRETNLDLEGSTFEYYT